ncbi:ISL3 family transposase [Variovorax sp. J22R133]|uniref:ISL3 family transposase n=1 Tax=Variovorax brevis TaxID=3053503 RepID=UPI002578F6CD|nr:ISL3 family transposase [Variovorax sp. J22R133]MDM0117538.1 ISL3 family transposase [Variovorax sp. J22R133]
MLALFKREVAMTVIPGLSQPLRTVGKRVGEWNESDVRLRVDVCGSVRGASCPSCSRRSSRVHGRYRRRLDDRPCFGQRVTLSIEVRRFKCLNPNCTQRTCSEPLDSLAASKQRRTQRLNASLRSLGYALGGAAAARLAARLGMGTSGDTVLRELRRAGCPAPQTQPVVIGIDDWAIKRGHRYGTVIVDLQTRRPIEVLAGRETTIVTKWLQQHPSVEIVARDRAGAYSEAARAANPRAQQVADRWHLLTNLREAVERLLVRRAASLREAARSPGEAPTVEARPITDTYASQLKLNIWQRLGIHRRAARLARYEEVMRRRQLGETYKAIGRAMNLDQRTVSKFVSSRSFPERAPRTRGPTLLDGHRQHLDSRVAEGCVNAAHVWHELQAQGFAGSLNTVRSAMARAHAGKSHGQGEKQAARGIACPSSRQAFAWLVGWHGKSAAERKGFDQQCFVERLCKIEPAIAVAGSLTRHFLGLIHRRDLDGFDRWLAKASDCDVPEMRRFATGLKADLSAVRAAFTSEWSSGQVEGQVNRLKFLKRQMYGRAKLDLLRIRVLHSN